jgi:hypothetical protein
VKTIRIGSLLIGFAIVAAGAAAGADDALEIAGSGVGEDGVLTHRVAEVVGDTGPTATPILTIASPHVAGSVYQITGTVEYSDVQGDGYLEMGIFFPDGDQFAVRTLDPTGALGKLSGSSGSRPFAMPIELVADAPPPSRIALNVVLPGPGHVKVSNLRLSGGTATAEVPGAWWSARVAAPIGGAALGVVGASIGVLCVLGRYQRVAEALLIALLGLGVGGFVAGAVALALGQPREVWFPLLLTGILAALLPIALRREVRRHFTSAEPPGLRA